MGPLRTTALRVMNGGMPMSTQDKIAANARADNQFYHDTFADDAYNLRNIALGFGIGNEYNAARTGVDTAGRMFDSAASGFARDQIRAGKAIDPSEQASQNRRLGLARVIAQVDSANRASSTARSAQNMASQFSTQQYGDLVSGSNGILNNIAQNEASRDAQYKNAKSSSKAAALGTLATVGMMFL